MAWRMKVRLPSLRVTQRSCGSSPVTMDVPRGRLGYGQAETGNVHEGPLSCPGSPASVSEVHEDLSDTTLHEMNEAANAEGWQRVRSSLLHAVTQSFAMPLEECCRVCHEAAECRCIQCGPAVYYCLRCFETLHSVTNIFHTAEMWEDGVYKPVVIENKQVNALLPHTCSTKREIPLCCIDTQGAEHRVKFVCCQCEPTAVTMVRARLWPASPRFPKLAFTFELLEWAEALLLECQVALSDFCKALYFKCPHLVNKRKDIYAAMINAFEEYRYMKVEVQNLTYITAELDSGNICPACPKETGSVIVSMDALFGLPRKKSAGQSHKDPLYGHIFFKDQHSVDEHVAAAPQRNRADRTCSDFLAGDVLRSSNRYKALDETAVFGCGCRHEFPLMFINLKHGERISYAEWMLKEMVHYFPAGVKLFVMYDIACTLNKYLENNGDSDIMERIQLSLPSFHAYGHKPQCQVVFSPLRCDGVGLSDGEVMERLWSYLRRFSRMTKEMRPSHRTDVLCHALIYYGYKTKEKLGPLLLNRWKKASQMRDVARKTYEELISSLQYPVSDTIIQCWIKEEKEVLLHSTSHSSLSTMDWRSLYFLTLQAYYMLRENFAIGKSTSEQHTTFAKLSRLDKQLSELEHRHKVVSRWHVRGPQYIEAKCAYLRETQQRVRASLWATITRRQFLLKMKAKYGDGQKIAKKLSKNITKETVKARKLLDEFNVCSSQIDPHFPPVMLGEILTPTSKFWQSPHKQSEPIPVSVKRDIIEAYLLQKRCEEELLLLQDEMHNVVDYYNEKEKKIDTALHAINSGESNQFSRGCNCLLKQLKWRVSLFRSRAVSFYSPVISIPESPESQTDNSESSESEYEGSSDDDLSD